MPKVNRTYHPRGKLVDGLSPRRHPLYNVWSGMLARCYNSERPNWKDYGGRGIKVCARWFDFESFVRDMGARPSADHSIERTNVNGDYEHGNCVWATRQVQNSNKRVYATSKTGVSGIRERNGKFQVRVIENGKRKSIGNFPSFEEALAARARFVEAAACVAES